MTRKPRSPAQIAALKKAQAASAAKRRKASGAKTPAKAVPKKAVPQGKREPYFFELPQAEKNRLMAENLAKEEAHLHRRRVESAKELRARDERNGVTGVTYPILEQEEAKKALQGKKIRKGRTK